MFRHYFSIAVCVGLCVSATPTLATTSTAAVTLDLASFTVETTGTLAVEPFFIEIDNTARAFDTSYNLIDVSTNVYNPLSATFPGPASVSVPGVGSATAGDPFNIYAFASADFGNLDATSKGEQTFLVSGAGTLTASIDFLIELDEPVGPWFNSGHADLFISFIESGDIEDQPFASVAVADTIDLVTFDIGGGPQMLAGTLTATVDIPRTNIFSGVLISGQVQARASVIPIPAAMWLFGSALGLLGWVKRRAG